MMGRGAVKIDTEDMIYTTMTEVYSFGKALVPKSLLAAIGADTGDRLQWVVLKDGTVMVYKVKIGGTKNDSKEPMPDLQGRGSDVPTRQEGKGARSGRPAGV